MKIWRCTQWYVRGKYLNGPLNWLGKIGAYSNDGRQAHTIWDDHLKRVNLQDLDT
jgi:hypothetical protein